MRGGARISQSRAKQSCSNEGERQRMNGKLEDEEEEIIKIKLVWFIVCAGVKYVYKTNRKSVSSC